MGYTFYLRMRDADFFNALGIGIGGSFIPTNLDDNGGFEPGFAVHAKLFNGAIETGYGRALGVDDGEFWFVGTDLFTLGTQLGGLVESF